MAYITQEFFDNQTILTAGMLNHMEEGIVNMETQLINKADLNDQGKIRSEQLPDNLLTKENVQEIIQNALNNAKSEGIFNGKNPEKGKDYWTQEDKNNIISEILSLIQNGNEVAY